MNLAEYENLWDHSLKGNKAAIKELGGNVNRLLFYQELTESNYISILKKMFIRLDSATAIPWASWAKEYYDKYLPKSWELNETTYLFPKLLKEKAKQGELDEHFIELVSYELAEFRVYTHPEVRTISNSERLRLNPAHELLILKYDIPSWVLQLEKDDYAHSTPKQEDTILVITRSLRTANCQFTKLDLINGIIFNYITESELDPKNLFEKINMLLRPGEKNITLKSFNERILFLKKQSILY